MLIELAEPRDQGPPGRRHEANDTRLLLQTKAQRHPVAGFASNECPAAYEEAPRGERTNVGWLLAKPAPAAPEAVNMASVNLREAAERLMAGGKKAEAINTGHPSKEGKRRMKKTKWMATATAALVMAALGGAYAQQQAQRNVNDWLLNAPDDTTRFQLLQRYLRGFDQPMWEVGERFRMIHQALADENWELAVYHWEKTRDTIVNGYLKRPLRQPNSQAMFVDSVFQPTLAAFRAGNPEKAWEAFQTARAVCMACHEAERVTYMNNQALFRLTERPARPGG